jgi:transcriptional regulator with XRE-family HTH domain
MREIALQIRRLREALGLTQEDLAARCRAAAEEILGPEDRLRAGRPSRTRIAHIEQAHRTRPGKGVAMALQPHEVKILAHALGVSPEQLVGEHAERIVTWDPLTNPERARHFTSLLDEAGRSARALLGWAEFLPCSLETRDFMHAHHEAIFRADALHLPEELRSDYTRAVVRMYDTIGDRRREDLLGAAAARPWVFTHMMLRSDLERIAAGAGPYEAIGDATRRACLAHVRALVADRSLRVDLVIAEDREGLRELFQGFDSMVVFDGSLAFWRHYSGDIAYTTHPSIVRLRRNLLETFREHAAWRETGGALHFLDDLVASIGGGPPR